MKKILIPYFFLLFFLSCIIICILLFQNANIEVEESTYEKQEWNIINQYVWPVIGYNKITSYFGKREAPTKGASTYHSGIDIGAPAGSNLVSIIDGTISYVGFKGAGGYTIIVKSEDIEIIYCHVHDNYLPKLNSKVKKGEVIGKVGNKNVYNVPNNPYYDKNRKPTNGATTGPHLHFAIKKDGQYINPLNIIAKRCV